MHYYHHCLPFAGTTKEVLCRGSVAVKQRAMKKDILLQEKELIGSVRYQPAVSIIMPFEPKISLKTELDQRLKFAYDKVQRMLKQNYPPDKAEPVLKKLSDIIAGLNFDKAKQSICIYVSPLVEKVYYLDVPVAEKIIVDESFEIRDLVYSRKELHEYLVLVLSAEKCAIYLGNGKQLLPLALKNGNTAETVKNDVAERVSNFSDPQYRKEVLMDKFLRLADENLGDMLKMHPFPVFVLGTERTVGHFKQITRHERQMVQVVHGNFEQASEAELYKVVEPAIEAWKADKQKQLLQQLESAMGAGKLAVGMQEVWKTAVARKGRLLVIEKHYRFAAYRGATPDEIFPAEATENHPFHIQDAVDDVIEMVLENGGDIAFVDEPLLAQYDHIALITFY